MKTNFNKLAVVAVLMTVAAGAMAEIPVERGDGLIPQKTVRFDDLDLSKPAGAAMLHYRLRVATNEVCVDFSTDLRGDSRRQCRIAALERAVSQVPALQSYHSYWVAKGSKLMASPKVDEEARQIIAAKR